MVVGGHPNFLLLFIVDPSYGEVSRAMHNRGMEIFMMRADWTESARGESESWQSLRDGLNEDAYSLLVHAGIPCLSLHKSHVWSSYRGQVLYKVFTWREGCLVA